jgi:hypothetical protein
MKSHDQGDAPTIGFRAHPPERFVRSLARGHIAGACCCCCCCCLHSLGSLAGAAIGSFYPRVTPTAGEMQPSAKLRDDELDGPPGKVAARSPARSLYWLVTLGVSVLASTFVLVMSRQGDPWAAFWVLAIFMPAIQLGASLLCALIFGGVLELRQDVRAWKRLGFITLWTIFGCILGFLIMYIIAKSR